MSEPGVARTFRIIGVTDADGFTPIVWTRIERDAEGMTRLVDGEPDRIRTPRRRFPTIPGIGRAAIEEMLKEWHP